MNSVVVNNARLLLIDGLSIVQDCQHKILSDIEAYDMTDGGCINIKHDDTRRVFYFYTLKAICDVVIESQQDTRCVVMFNDQCVKHYDFDFIKYYQVPGQQFCKFIQQLFTHMDKILPTQFFIQRDEVCFSQLMQDGLSGECRELINDINSQHAKKAKKVFTFEKAKKFINKYQLTYLNNEYFNKEKIKSLLYK